MAEEKKSKLPSAGGIWEQFETNLTEYSKAHTAKNNSDLAKKIALP